MSAMGQNRISSLRVYVFRFAPESGHRALRSACLFRARIERGDFDGAGLQWPNVSHLMPSLSFNPCEED
jgi:hypothetical protein